MNSVFTDRECGLYVNEPAIKNGDLVKQGGDYLRTRGIDNMIIILVGTDSGYWGNLIEPEKSKIPGGLEKLDGEPITSTFLGRHSAAVEKCLQPIITNDYAKSITVESFNPSADRIEWTARITLNNGKVYCFDSETSTGVFIEG